MINTNQSILITGATGFLGSYIIRSLLSQGYHKLYATHRSSSSFDLLSDVKKQLRWIELDLTHDFIEMDEIDQIDVIIHAASLVSLDKKDKAKLFSANIEGTASLINFALEKKVNRFIYISSATALGKAGDQRFIDENTEWDEAADLSEYAVSKQYAEREVYRGMMEGIDVIILNPSMIIGVGPWDQPPLTLFGLIRNGLSFYTTGSTGIVDVRDVAYMTSLMVSEEKYLGQKIILSADNISFKKLNEQIARSFKVKAPSRALGYGLSVLARVFDYVKSVVSSHKRIITKQSVEIAQHPYLYDNSKSKSVDGFSYRSVEESIEEVCQAWVESHENI